jgi:ribosome-binding ATPase YchF (GTP1/OBG family)
MGLLTAKPVLYLVNTDDPGDPPVEIAEYAAEQGAQALALPVGVELELAEMDPDEAAEFAEEMGLGSTRGADAVIQAGYRLLDLITFFTGSGPPEARAWPIPRGTPADKAAGKIHSDMERGFIRAEVVAWDKLVECGSFSKARDVALARMEGKDYIVQEGDVMQIRFNV